MARRPSDLVVDKTAPKTIMLGGQKWVTVAEAATRLDVHWTRVYFLVRKGTLRSARIGNRAYIPEADIKRYKQQRDWWIGLHSPHAQVG